MVKYMVYAYAPKVQMVNIMTRKEISIYTLLQTLGKTFIFGNYQQSFTFKSYWKPVITGSECSIMSNDVTSIKKVV